MDVNINDTNVKLQLGTGSDITLINENTWKSNWEIATEHLDDCTWSHSNYINSLKRNYPVTLQFTGR